MHHHEPSFKKTRFDFYENTKIIIVVSCASTNFRIHPNLDQNIISKYFPNYFSKSPIQFESCCNQEFYITEI